MAQLYNVTQYPIDVLLSSVKAGEIAIPEIQRPFVWKAAKVRDLLDSLYRGYPVGYLIAWRNPTVKLKSGESAAGKRILIDGQQRVTALMASLLGREVLTKDYKTVRIRIAFHPGEERFEVRNPAIAKNSAWIEDVTSIFGADADWFALVDQYMKRNPATNRRNIEKTLHKVGKIINNPVGMIELRENLDIETVTEIFIRVNSAGEDLSQADFAMSKIAVNEEFGGNVLRKAIDYFCHLAVAPEYFSRIVKNDPDFARSEFLPKMRWIKDVNDDLYDPTYTDMLRVAFTSEFGRGKLQDLVALLSGRNFETRAYEERIAEKSFAQLKKGILAFMNKTHFKRVVMILRSAGFIIGSLIHSRNAVNFAYILYLHGRKENLPADKIERLVRRWYVMSILTGRYGGSPETTFDSDIRQVNAHGLQSYTEAVIENELPSTFWTGMLQQEMNTASTQSPYFIAYQAAQAKLGDLGLLSTDITVHDLLRLHGDKHHIFPRKHLQKDRGLKPARYNQIANLAITQSEINIDIGDTSPDNYFGYLINEQSNGGKKRYGGIDKEADWRAKLAAKCIPANGRDGAPLDYDEFRSERRQLMASKSKEWFMGLS